MNFSWRDGVCRAAWTVLLTGLPGVLSFGASIYWDDGDGGSSTIGSAAWNDIQTALDSAGNNPSTPGTVKLYNDFARTPSDATVGSLEITHDNITLSGGWDATFTTQSGRSVLDVKGANSAGNQFRVLEIGATNVLVQNVVITNGYLASGAGAGIDVKSNAVAATLQNLVVVNNSCPLSYSGAGGGGIRIGQGYPSINVVAPSPDGTRVSDCEIIGNIAAGSGGGILVQNTGSATAPVIIERCTVANNFCPDPGQSWRYAIGGGIAVVDAADTGSAALAMASHVIIANCRIIGNRNRTGSGVGTRSWSSGLSLTMFGCLMAGNYWNSNGARPANGNGVALGDGGEMSFHPPSTYLVSCTVADNTHPTTPGSASGLFVTGNNYSTVRLVAINCVSRSNDLGFLDLRKVANGQSYVDLQNTTVHEASFIEIDSVEGNVTSATFAAAINTSGNAAPGFRSLTSGGVLSQAMEQNIDADPMFLGEGDDPYQLSRTSGDSRDNGLTVDSGSGFTYVDVNLDGSYSAMRDVIVDGVPPGGNHLVYTTDLLGNPRLDGPDIDRGAYEFISPKGTVVIFR